jgi:CHAD domain-containing protein
VNNAPQEVAATIARMPAGSERNERSAVALRANGDFTLPEIEGRPLEKRLFTATYYDTPGARLARAGITLRRRMENGNNVWELELPREPEPLRLDAPGGPSGPPPLLARLLTGVVRGAPLEEVRTIRTRRAGVRVASGGLETVEALVDSISVLDGRRVEEQFTEISLRPLDSDTRRLRALSKELCRAGAQPHRRRRASYSPADTAGAADVKAMLERQLALILAHDPAVRLGDDAEDVHQLRVATRRFRAVLRAARPFFTDGRAEGLRVELAWLADLLGSVRDLDVLIERAREERAGLDPSEQAGAAHVVDLLVAEREAARARLVTAMRTKRYMRLLARLEELLDRPPIGDEDVRVEKRARKEFKKVRKAASALTEEATDDEIHTIRVRVKRARYTAELAERAVGKRASQFIRRAKRVQDVAGELQDAVVAEERIRALSERIERPDAAFAAGRLVERARARRAAAREAWPEAWAAFEKSGQRVWA